MDCACDDCSTVVEAAYLAVGTFAIITRAFVEYENWVTSGEILTGYAAQYRTCTIGNHR